MDDIRIKDLNIEALWYEMAEVRYRGNRDGDIVIAEDWHIWEEGTSIYEIREWFDNNHSKGIKHLQDKIY